jgi:hypothetical protein
MSEPMKSIKFTRWHGAYNAGTIAGFPASTAAWLVKHGKAVYYEAPVTPKADAPPPKRSAAAEKMVTK